MTNTPLLLLKIRQSGLKMLHVAKALGITRQSLHDKIYNKTEFKASQIEILCTILDIGVADRMAIFFAGKVD